MDSQQHIAYPPLLNISDGAKYNILDMQSQTSQ